MLSRYKNIYLAINLSIFVLFIKFVHTGLNEYDKEYTGFHFSMVSRISTNSSSSSDGNAMVMVLPNEDVFPNV